MLASPLYPTSSFAPQLASDDHSQFRPARDIEAFNSLLPPPIEFVEGSSSGTLAVAEGKYEPINATPKASKNNVHEHTRTPSTPLISPSKQLISSSAKRGSLFTGVLDFSWPWPGHNIGNGLHNTGNTCFLNSALQCLLHTPPLVNILMAHSKSDPCRVRGGFCMSCNLRQVMLDSHQKKHPSTPFFIVSKLHLIAKHMRKGRQEDSHEFLRYAIDALQKSCLAGYPPKIDPKLAETSWVHKIFGGRLRSRVTCKECHYNSDTFDSMLDVSLDIYGTNSVRDAFRKFVAVDCLKGSDKYKCEKCKKPVVAEKRFTIHDAPAVLTIHLKRFSPLGRKIGHFVHYDEHITLKPFMSEGQFGPTYSLYGVICHAGGGPNSGHYYAMVRGANGMWYEMNDDSVSPHRGIPMSLKNAYMLFYIREKGQSLEAAISRPSMTPRNIVAGMKKRKALDSEDDGGDDLGVKTTRPFIGPLLPSPMGNDVEVHKKPKTDDRDPQAESIKKKIEAASKVPGPSTALTSLSQYNDDDDDDSGSSLVTPVDLKPPSSTTESVTAASSSPPCPPTSPPPRNSSAAASTSSISSVQSNNTPSSGISPSTFYASSNKNDKKRKSPDYDDDEHTPQKHYARVPLHTQSSKHGHRRKSSFGGGAVNPYGRLAGSNTLNRSENWRPVQQYGRKRKKMLI
ncbi:cysteine proteinase [Rhizopogon vinicolor AM-OR11-026]|uniref:Ubiquitin carboxyl-terminal hydrolase n=1 Tax=Rhizopogon vinicolor AM-OR11-026 TaxID=1314800 RepID=A0A1B7NGP4_9AGAM|nr:cysteine proteinase [Rhizopogon vinicolor AM-OR11-026]